MNTDTIEQFARGTHVDWNHDGERRYGFVKAYFTDNDGILVARVGAFDNPGGGTINIDADLIRRTR